jgi:hypothetical protein
VFVAQQKRRITGSKKNNDRIISVLAKNKGLAQR